ncbi:hypothetical protein [Arthrobacter sp. Alg241-R88]|uniref:hypothetical protein n=1 Tax=Arthrobacter sp. Alg241-R88 TaxID=2305984 RepID=UPI001F076A1F|nr:hypothetical protein [Arthrobacter sp. Alg241-R88]
MEPTITVPVVDALNPVPETVTAEPAGPDEGLKAIWPAGAACAGWIKATAIPAATTKAITKVLSDLNTTTILRVSMRPAAADLFIRNALAQVLDVKTCSLIKKHTILFGNHSRVCAAALT